MPPSQQQGKATDAPNPGTSWRARIAGWLRPALEALRPPSRELVWRWGEKHYKVIVGSRAGDWRLRNSPWVRKLTEKFPDNRIRLIVVLCSAQSSKTETMILLLCWVISEDPAGAMWVSGTGKGGQAELDMIERIWPAFEKCEPVRRQIPTGARSLKKIMQVIFPTMTFEAGGANSKQFLQGRVRRWLFLDEVRNWRPHALPMVLKRVRTYWNARIMIASTPAEKNDTVDREFMLGTQEHYHVECPCCGRRVTDLQFKYHRGDVLAPGFVAEHDGGLEWSTNEKTKPSGVWNFDEVAKTIRYVWPCCGGASLDRPDERQRIAESGEWVAYNPEAPPHRLSFTWSALLPTWVTWASVVEEFLVAAEDLKHGHRERYKAFWTETLGRSWDPNLAYIRDDQKLATLREDYDVFAPWAEESRRVLICDVQKTGIRHFPFIVRAYARYGASRLIAAGIARSKDEIASVAAFYGVKPQNVGLDTGHAAFEIYDHLIRSGDDGKLVQLTGTVWKGFKGEPAAFYEVGKVQQPWRWSEWLDPYSNDETKKNTTRSIRLLLFSKAQLLDRLEAAQKGFGPPLRIPKSLPMTARDGSPLPYIPTTIETYISQSTAYERQVEKDARGVETVKWHQLRADHMTSCEMMAMVMAMATGIYTPPPPPPPKRPPEEAGDDAEIVAEHAANA